MQPLRLSIVYGQPAIPLALERPGWRDAEGRLCARVFGPPDRWWVEWIGTGTFEIDRARSNVRVWPAPSATPADVQRIFAERLQPLILQRCGYQALHASASLVDRAAVIICGRSGSGKSTLARALHHAGCRQLADDAVVVSPRTTPALLHPLRFTPRAPFVEPDRDPAPSDPAALPGPPVPIGLVVLLEPGGTGRPVAHRLPPPHACVRLLAHAHAVDPGESPATLVADYAALADQLPVQVVTYRHTWTTLSSLVALVRTLAAEAHRRPTSTVGGGA